MLAVKIPIGKILYGNPIICERTEDSLSCSTEHEQMEKVRRIPAQVTGLVSIRAEEHLTMKTIVKVGEKEE